ncbi:class I SAM-dependent methyltransferase [Nostoc sp. UHCC 0702]|nr:class I SAM-dependent methyltransferase [Nostoc sp. UHCC 0702]
MKVANVPEDLFKPVYFRAKETQRADGIIKDALAVTLVEMMSPNCPNVDDWTIQFGIAIHTLLVDKVVKQFLRQHSDAVIITLGGGLATRPFLLDNGQAEWFCIDAPDVEVFWNQLIGESERNHFIPSAVTDLTWMNQIVSAGRAVLFIAEGVFLYLTESEVKQVILSLQQRFPNSEIVMEVIGKFILRSSQIFRSKAIPGGRFQWAIDDCSTMLAWDSRITLIKEYFCYDYYKERQGVMKFLPFLVGGKQKLLKVAHFRLSDAQSIGEK